MLQQVERALADFDHTVDIGTVRTDVHPDPSVLLDIYVSQGAMWQWINYAHAGHWAVSGADETLWRRHLRAFAAQREETKSRDVSFLVAFMIATAIEITVDKCTAQA